MPDHSTPRGEATLTPPRALAPDWVVLALVCLGQFMVLLDVSIVNVALPSIRTSLGFSQTGLQWVVNAYTLTFAGFLLLGGRAADLFGRRRIFILGLAMFSLASLVGGFAQNQGTLIAARAIQGLGGAVLSPATLTILTTTFAEGRARSRALGIWSAVAGAGGATGALLGGILTNYLSWRWILFVNVPIGIAALVAARAFLVESRNEGEDRSLDLAGAITVTAGLVALVYAIVRTDQYAWTSWQTVSTLAVSASLLGLFLFIEARVARHPLMPLQLFKLRSVAGANVVMLFIAGAMFAMWFFLSLYMQNVLGFSPLTAGLGFLPQTAAIVVGAAVSSRLVTRLGPRPLLVVGTAMSAGGLLWLSQISATGSYLSDLLVPSVIITLGLGLSFTPVTVAATAGVPGHEAGLASGLVNTTRQVGGSVGLAALATVAADRTRIYFAHALATTGHPSRALAGQALTAGFGRAFAVSAGIAFLGTLATALVPSIGTRGPSTPRLEEAATSGAEVAVSVAEG
jgi:EmrB/QacA subfamily drug resistance transporter